VATWLVATIARVDPMAIAILLAMASPTPVATWMAFAATKFPLVAIEVFFATARVLEQGPH